MKNKEEKTFFQKLRPGIITGSADNDPAGIATYSQIGAVSGFSLLWLLIFITPLLFFIEEMAARVGVVTGRGLAFNIKKAYSLKVALFAVLILLICNVATIGADIAGLSAAIGLVFSINFVWFVIPVTIFLIYLLLSKNFQTINKFLLFLAFIFLAYIFAGILAHPDWREVAKDAFYPEFKRYTYTHFILAIGLLGTVIAPYLIFWQTTEEVEDHVRIREYKEGSRGVFLGMIYSNLIAFFIIVASAVAVKTGGRYIVSAADAAAALQPAVGDLAYILFALGIFAGGLLAIPVLSASSAYALSEVLEWRGGLDKKFKFAKGFYIIILFSLIAGGLIALFGIKPMLLLFYTQVLNGILMPLLIFLLLLIINNSEIMGRHVNRIWSNVFGVLTLFLFIGLDMVMIWEWVSK